MTGDAAWFPHAPEGERFDRFHLDGSPMPPEEWPIVRALAGETVPRDVYRLQLPDGRMPLIESRAAPVRRDDGTILGAVTTFDDVTEREARSKADREFVANAAHQIRTPITAIASSVAALNAGALEEPEARERFVRHIDNEVQRLARLAESLLALARLQRGEASRHLTDVVLRPLLHRVVRETRALARVPCRLRCPTSLVVRTDEGLLEEALASVLANAAEVTESGEIRVVARRLAAETVVDVVDTGPGIPAEEVGYVFERFYRGSGRRERRGAGLGLSIAADAARAAGASIELASRPGVGTRVRFRFRADQRVR
jgi:signal transduction histidine kinase